MTAESDRREREAAAIEVVRRVLACDNGRDRAGYRALLHDDYVAEVNGRRTVSNADDEAENLTHYWAAFSDGRIVEDSATASGGLVTLRYRLVGTNDGPLAGRPASGHRVEVAACTILEVADGRVRRVWRYIDTLQMMQQTGAAGA